MKIEIEKSLLNYNTFGIKAKCNKFITLDNKRDFENQEFQQCISLNEKIFILGGGSNILLTKDFNGTFLFPFFKGISIVEENAENIIIKVGAGENWHEFVTYSLKENWFGLENLALIPGHIGATPVQNIGAYGIEVKDFIYQVKAFDLKEKKFIEFSNTQCNFGYRNSIFKDKENQNRYIIYEVYYKLLKKAHPNTNYLGLKSYFEKDPKPITPHNIYQAVVEIRRKKLPNPDEVGNAGSFFKNPIISKEVFRNLKKEYPNIAHYPFENEVKIPAGWLIENQGWKGRIFEEKNYSYGIHPNQALVIVNYKNTTGDKIDFLANRISSNIKNTFNIKLEREVLTL